MVHIREDPAQGHITENKRWKKPRTEQESNPQPLYYKACAIPLPNTAKRKLLNGNKSVHLDFQRLFTFGTWWC